MLNETRNPLVVQALLGHANVRTTLDVYGHVMVDQKRESIAALHNRYASGA